MANFETAAEAAERENRTKSARGEIGDVDEGSQPRQGRRVGTDTGCWGVRVGNCRCAVSVAPPGIQPIKVMYPIQLIFSKC